MLTLTELRRAAGALEAALAGHRLQGVSQPDELSIALTTYGGRESGRRVACISCRPDCARVSMLAAEPKKGVGTLAQYLRAHLMGARIGGVRILDDDRQLAIHLSSEEGEFELLLTILGPRSNVYLLDGEQRIVLALRSLADTRPELELGGAWRSPTSRPRSEGEDRFVAEPDHRLLAAIEAHYAEIEARRSSDDLHRRVEQALRKERRALDRKLAKLDESLAEAREAGQLERDGELLKGVLSRVSRGDTEVVAEDFASGEQVTIALDPMLGPADNLERIFKRYRKAVRSLTKAGARADAVREARGEIEGLEARFGEIVASQDSSDAVAAFAQEPAVGKLVNKYSPAQAPAKSRGAPVTERRLGKRTVPARLMPRRYQTAGGLEIWVGRSAVANDHLSLRLARGKDLFFHLDGAPGSHVVLRTEGREDPPAEAVLDACELAVHFSKHKNATRADVHAVPIANVRKPKGAKPGLVSVHGGKTIHLRRMQTRLDRILAARIEDEA